jgi:ferredoxin
LLRISNRAFEIKKPMPSKADLKRQLSKVQFLSSENKRMLQDAIDNCPEDQLDLLVAVVDRADQKARKIQQAYQEKRVTMMDEILRGME